MTSSEHGHIREERRLESDPAPLSSGQEQLWFLAQLAPELPVYNEQVVIRRRGALDIRALERSLEEITRRHAVWRTSIVSRDGRPVQVVHPHAPITMEVSDLSGLPLHRREAAAAKLVTEDLVRPFDLERGPLWRARLVRVGQEDHRLYVAMHHIMFDGFSIFRILAPELTALYGLYSSGAVPVLPEPRIAYEDFARSQQARAESPTMHRQLEYWRQRLAALPALDLPADRPRPPLQSFRGAMHRFSIPRPLVDGLLSVAASQGATLFVVLLATFAAVLHHFTDQEDVVVGTLSSGRRSPELADVFGYFLNPLVVRVGLGGDPDGRQVISRVQEALLEALANDEVAFERVVRELGGTRDPGRNPLFQVMLTLEPSLPELPPGWAVSQNEVDDGTSKFDLSVELDERPEGMIARLAYRTDLFGASTIRRLVEAWRRVMEAIAARPDTKLQEVPVLGEAERHTLLVGWNATAMVYDDQLCVHQTFEAQVERTPDAVALVAGSERLTYRELDRKANQLGHHLRGLGLGPGARVGIYAERSAAMVVALLGVLKAGAAYVPMDPAFPARRIEFMVGDARVPVVVTTRELAGGLAGCGARLVLLDAEAEAIGREEEGPVASGVSVEELAYVMYTSGSTGTPKGVQVTHRNVVNFFAAMDERLEHEPPGVWLAVTSISFDISVLELFWTLARGFQVVLYAGDETAAPVARPRVARRTRELDFSLFYFGAGEGPSPDAKYRLLLDGARFGDQEGFAAIWTPERHFHAFGGLYPNPAVLGAAIATITNRIGIRAGSCVSPLHSVIRIAEEWSVVDNLSRGRVGISFASGWQPDDFVLAPENFADRKNVMARQIDMVRRLWCGESIWLPGPLGKDVQVSIMPHPIQPDLPVWITSAGSPDTFRVAGEMGCNVLTHLLGQSVEEVREKVTIYRDAWRAAGRGPGQGHVTLMLHSFVGGSDGEVKEQVRAPMKGYLRSSVGLIQRAAWSFPAFKKTTTDAEGRFALDHLSAADMDAVLDFSFERYFETSGLLGSAEKCLALIDDLRDTGIDEIACLIDFVDDTELVLEHLPLLGRVREKATPTAAPVAVGEVEVRHPVAWLIEEQGVTHLQCTPSFASMLLASPGCAEALGRLKQLMIGGEPFPVGLARELRRVMSGSIVNMYGPTETTIWSSTYELGQEIGEWETIPIGRPIGNTTFYVLDGQMRPVPVGVKGELYIGGEGVTRGYLERPELNRERFLADPFGRRAGGCLYRTGDLARYREDGLVEHLGRVDNQVKLRGYRIELGEIESVLSTHPEVRENAVVVRGEGAEEERLVAYLVARQGQGGGPSVPELRQYLEERLPKYMVPAAFELLEALPRTPNGKVDRKSLPDPQREVRQLSEALIAPRDEVERELVEIWERELKVQPIGINENFFQLGGHSLLAVQIFNEIATTFGTRLPLATLLHAPTVELLAETLRQVP